MSELKLSQRQCGTSKWGCDFRNDLGLSAATDNKWLELAIEWGKRGWVESRGKKALR